MISKLRKAFTMFMTIPPMLTAADPSLRIINGSYKISNTVISEKLKINGQAVLGENTVVTQPLIVNGQLIASGVTFEAELFANGASTFTDSTLKDAAHLSGNVTASSSEMLKALVIYSQQAFFQNCKTKDITVRKLPYGKSSQLLDLKSNSTVNGDITFEGGNGKVHSDTTSNVEGVIHGGIKIPT